MARLLLYALSDDLHSHLLCHRLDALSIARLDVAVSSATTRLYWITLLKSLRSASIDNMHHSASSLMWMIHRRICASRVQMKGDGWRVPGCDLSLLKTINLLHLGLNDCSNVTDECLLKGLTGCNESVCEDISGYNVIRDAGVSALGAKCGQLKSIDLTGCRKVTDAGVSALGAGCGQLLSFNLTFCDKVTDTGVSALGAGCGQLQSIDLTCCDKVADAGVSALGAGCGQLLIINLGGCSKVTDAGVSALGAGCGQLQSIDLTFCGKVTDAGVAAFGSIIVGILIGYTGR